MGVAVHWRPGDGRSRRLDRVPIDIRLFGRLLPSTPLDVQDGLAEALPLRQLHELLEPAASYLSVQLPELSGQLPMSNGHYPELLGVLFGGHQRELLAAGTYVLTDSSPAQRVLYVGSSVDGSMRSRLISHLFEQGRGHLSQQAYRAVVAGIQSGMFADEQAAELALRHALFGANRWAVSPSLPSRLRAQAIELVSYGAFNIAAVHVPHGYETVARCLERYFVEVVLRKTGGLPPLNDARVAFGRELQRKGRFDGAMVRLLVKGLDGVADRVCTTR